jgi:hypothetical protein
MSFVLNAYQTEFRTKITPELQAQFDIVVNLANKSADVAAFVAALPASLQSVVAGLPTIADAVNKLFSNTNWGGVIYSEPKTAVPSKAKAAKKASAAPPVAGADVPTKRRGNPDALRKAREAKGGKTPEQIAADKKLIIDTTVEVIKSKITADVKAVHVVALCDEVTAKLVGKGSDGKDVKIAAIYKVITDTGKDIATSPFIPVEMDGHKRGYSLKG